MGESRVSSSISALTNRFRAVASFLLLAVATLAAAGGTENIKGTLTRAPGGAPLLRMADGKLVHLEGDKDTIGVIKDARLHEEQFEARGEWLGPDRFRIGPIHTKAMWVHRNGERLLITYWCEVCSIRTYTPGICWCCQQETELDLRHSHEEH